MALWLSGFLPIVIAFAATTIGVDPGRVIRLGFGDRDAYEKQIAAALAGGANLTGLLAFDERLMHRYLAARDTTRPEALVLGSSRTLQVRPDGNDPTPARNASVPGASMEDLVALYGLYVIRRAAHPGVLVLGVDPWMLNARSGQHRWKSLRDEYVSTRAELGLPRRKFPVIDWDQVALRASATFSPDYLKTSLRLLSLRLRGGAQLRLTRERTNDEFTRWSDGSIRYGKATRDLSLGDRLTAAKEYARETPMYGLGAFDRVDDDALAELEALIRDARSRRIAVAIVLPPYAPIVYARMRSDPAYARVMTSEEAVRHVASRNGVRVVGAYDPDRAGAEPGDFFDGMHLSEGGVAKVLPFEMIRGAAR